MIGTIATPPFKLARFAIPLRTCVESSRVELFAEGVSLDRFRPAVFVRRIVRCFLPQLATVHIFLSGQTLALWPVGKQPKQKSFDNRNWIRSWYGRSLSTSQVSKAWPELQKVRETFPTEGVVPEGGSSGDKFWSPPTCAAKLFLLPSDPLFVRPLLGSCLGFESSVIFPDTGLAATLASLSTNSARSRNVTERSSVSIMSTKRRHVFLILKGNFMMSFCAVSGPHEKYWKSVKGGAVLSFQPRPVQRLAFVGRCNSIIVTKLLFHQTSGFPVSLVRWEVMARSNKLFDIPNGKLLEKVQPLVTTLYWTFWTQSLSRRLLERLRTR